MRLLDLYCGAGGAAMGYHQAGFTEIVGVDINPQPNYPFHFVRADVFELGTWLEQQEWPAGLVAWLRTFDLIHASPPCKAHTKTGWAYHFDYHDNHEDLLTPTRRLLELSGVPWVIENVPGAPMRIDYQLCGSMFGLGVRRHRWFETSWEGFTLIPGCDHSRRVVSPHGNPNRFKGSRVQWAEAMGIDWMSGPELAQAIPPAYTKFIGEQFLAQVRV